MTWAMYEALGAHCRALAEDRSVRVVLMRGAGGEAFVSGTDIAQFLAFRDGEDGVAYERRIDAGITLWRSCRCRRWRWSRAGPSAAASRSPPPATSASRPRRALRRADRQDARQHAVDRQPGAAGGRLGLAARAAHAAAGQMIGAEEALECGYLLQACAPAEFDAAAAALCERLLALAPTTQSVVKEGLRRVVAANLPEGDDLVRRCYGSRRLPRGRRGLHRAPAAELARLA